jgi:hypothetical protein
VGERNNNNIITHKLITTHSVASTHTVTNTVLGSGEKEAKGYRITNSMNDNKA